MRGQSPQVPELVLEHDGHFVGVLLLQPRGEAHARRIGAEGDVEMVLARKPVLGGILPAPCARRRSAPAAHDIVADQILGCGFGHGSGFAKRLGNGTSPCQHNAIWPGLSPMARPDCATKVATAEEGEGKWQGSVARPMPAPPSGANLKGFGSVFQTALRGLSNRSISCRWQLLR